DAEGGIFYPDEGQVDPRLLMRALSVATVNAGARHLAGATVRRIVTEGNRVAGVEIDDRVLPAGTVVVTAGAWSALIPGNVIPPRAIKPARGQMLALDAGPPKFAPFVWAHSGYLVPRRDGRIVVGSTVELAGYDKSVTASGIAKLLEAAISTIPALADARIL